MAELIKEYTVETLGQLRAALADLPDDTPVTDAMCEPLLLSHCQSDKVSEGGQYPPLEYIEIQ